MRRFFEELQEYFADRHRYTASDLFDAFGFRRETADDIFHGIGLVCTGLAVKHEACGARYYLPEHVCESPYGIPIEHKCIDCGATFEHNQSEFRAENVYRFLLDVEDLNKLDRRTVLRVRTLDDQGFCNESKRALWFGGALDMVERRIYVENKDLAITPQDRDKYQVWVEETT